MSQLEVIVREIRRETPEICRFVLQAKPGETLPPFEAGAHIDVTPVPGVIRQYSLVNDPADGDRYVLGVKREAAGRGGSAAMHSQLRVGGTLQISAPKNNFRLRDTAGRSVLLAGGIGVTPLLSMAQTLARHGAEFAFHYFARADSELAFRDLITATPWSRRVTCHVGLVPPSLNAVLDEILRAPGPRDTIYLCGPTPFMDVVRACAAAAGWPAEAVILEHFTLDPPELPPDAGEFVVRLAKTGIDLVVPPDKAIIEVLRAAGVEIPTSCEQGVCGTCVTPVLEGEPEHNDIYLTDDERAEAFTPCVSRAKSKLLVLDL